MEGSEVTMASVKEPVINSRGVIEEAYRHDGPRYVDTRGQESYAATLSTHLFITIHEHGTVFVQRMNPRGDWEWASL